MRTKGPRPDKVATVDEMSRVLAASKGTIITHYRGLTVSELSAMRRRLREVGGEYHVVKNTLFRRAAADRLTPEVEAMLAGPTAIAFALEDPIATAKALLAALKDVRKPEVLVRGAWIDGKVYSADQVTEMSRLPAPDIIKGQLVGTIQAPLSEFAATMHGVLSEFARTLQALCDRHQEEAAPAA
ncbi:MAG TPA: 50S ribosomal protein L10 [Chthonomonadales bacterium]|nr:50S ribosomal protein L10 [Chthonomonadales bacterium]